MTQIKQNHTSSLRRTLSEVCNIMCAPLLLLFPFFLTYISVPADYDFISDGIHYSINADSKSVSVVYRFWKYSGDVVIPSTVVHEDKTYRVTGIGEDAFWYCSITSLDLPDGLASIGRGAISACSSLTTVICRAEAVPVCGNIKFSRTPADQATLYVPASAIEAYKAARPWKYFGAILPLEDYETGTGAPSSSQDGGTIAAP